MLGDMFAPGREAAVGAITALPLPPGSCQETISPGMFPAAVIRSSSQFSEQDPFLLDRNKRFSIQFSEAVDGCTSFLNKTWRFFYNIK